MIDELKKQLAAFTADQERIGAEKDAESRLAHDEAQRCIGRAEGAQAALNWILQREQQPKDVPDDSQDVGSGEEDQPTV